MDTNHALELWKNKIIEKLILLHKSHPGKKGNDENYKNILRDFRKRMEEISKKNKHIDITIKSVIKETKRLKTVIESEEGVELNDDLLHLIDKKRIEEIFEK